MRDEIAQKNILTLIGSEIKIVGSSDRSLKGLTGLVLDETKNMIIMRKNTRILKIPKKAVKIMFKQKSQRITVNGAQLIGLPENRIKNYYGRG